MFPQAFSTFFRGVYFVLTGNTKASDLKGDKSFLSFVKLFMLSYIFTVVIAFKIEDGKSF